MESGYLDSAIRQFEYYRSLGDKTFTQLPDAALNQRPNAESNSIATIVRHLSGNMHSRWTDLFTTDGEKPWRDREGEFSEEELGRDALMQLWDSGWTVFLDTLKSLTEDDLQRIVYIRNQGHTVLEAINRQLAHYPYHIGQIVYLGKMLADRWESLSIPKGGSQSYNADKFAQPKRREHFTTEFLDQTLDPKTE